MKGKPHPDIPSQVVSSASFRDFKQGSIGVGRGGAEGAGAPIIFSNTAVSYLLD